MENKACAEVKYLRLWEFYSHMIDASFSISNSVFPAAFKIAKELPLHKRDSIQERVNMEFTPKGIQRKREVT
ncbi:hypothetical protein P5673_033178 [Acropora cervicornis]|uniref:Uncharacterized protein n=1 Tax=Acropora cervicornis TaxID=6130 RepID=A0AAD9PQA3_ACRCE|nr:hypothetical protein P5673_033178 [Acropora cervicornis]